MGFVSDAVEPRLGTGGVFSLSGLSNNPPPPPGVSGFVVPGADGLGLSAWVDAAKTPVLESDGLPNKPSVLGF